MQWFRGDNGSGLGSWYTANREYAEFFGAVTTIEIPELDILDLTHYGVGEEETVVDEPGLPAYREYEMYQYVERADVRESARAQGFKAIRVLQWHAEFGDEPQDAIILT